jgi:hypothetical protein
MSDKIVRIGGASGAWGDSPRAIPQLLRAGPGYLMMDYLSEVTMSLLARARLAKPDTGWPLDFVTYLKPCLGDIAARGVKVVANAGGVNPAGCKRALEAACAEAGVALKIAIVEGDDVMPLLEGLRQAVREAGSGAALPARVLTANAYLGALPIAAALGAGADVVITGRCADSALALGVLIHEFGWRSDDYDRLAAGSLVGHLLECGPQATGGNHTDWRSVPGWENIGYPLAECSSSGAFTVCKPDGTGGLITPAVIAEQLLYEIGDPAAYVLPDVIADFSAVQLRQTGRDRVHVVGARGRAPTTTFKVSATYEDGYRAVATVSLVGPEAVDKAERTAQALVDRGRLIFAEQGMADFSAVHVEALGGEASYGHQSRARAAREVLLRLVVSHPSRQALDLFARELGSIGLSCAPGTTGIFGGRPKPAPVIKLFTFYIPKSLLGPAHVQVAEQAPFEVAVPPGVDAPAPAQSAAAAGSMAPEAPAGSVPAPPGRVMPPADSDLVDVPLARLAYARSGDKGDSANIAIIARRPEFVAVIRRELTAERMRAHFAGEVLGRVRRFEAPGLSAFNFLLEQALGGGGMSSMRIDPQGKAFGQRALEMSIRVPVHLLGDAPAGLAATEVN